MTVTVVSTKGPYPYASDVYNFIGLVLVLCLAGRQGITKACYCVPTPVLFHCHCSLAFLQRVSIACYAERCISHSKSVRLTVRLSHAGTESKLLKLRSWGLHWRIAP